MKTKNFFFTIFVILMLIGFVFCVLWIIWIIFAFCSLKATSTGDFVQDWINFNIGHPLIMIFGFIDGIFSIVFFFKKEEKIYDFFNGIWLKKI